MHEITFNGADVRPIMVFNDYGGSDLFVCYVEDCFSPAIYLVAGDSWQDAYDNFLVIPRVERDLAIGEDVAGNYDPETVHYNDNGTAVDDESAMCHGPVDVSWFGYNGLVPADLKAMVIASQWHSGQTSDLYRLASTGTITETCHDTILQEIHDPANAATLGESDDLHELFSYVMDNGVRGPQDGWSDLNW